MSINESFVLSATTMGAAAAAAATVSSLVMISFGIPLTGSMSVRFTIGFIKG